MAILVPAQFKAKAGQQITEITPSRDIAIGPMVVPVGGLAVAAANDIIQVSPKFEGPKNIRLVLSRLECSVDAGTFAANETLVLVGQESESELLTIGTFSGSGVQTTENGERSGAPDAQFRIYDGGFFVGVKRASTTAIAASKNVNITLAYRVLPTARPTHKVSDGTAY